MTKRKALEVEVNLKKRVAGAQGEFKKNGLGSRTRREGPTYSVF